MIEEVRLNHPVHLQVLEMVGDALEESLADVSVVRRRIRLSVMHCGAALRSATVSGARPVILIVRIADREFIVPMADDNCDDKLATFDNRLFIVVSSAVKRATVADVCVIRSLTFVVNPLVAVVFDVNCVVRSLTFAVSPLIAVVFDVDCVVRSLTFAVSPLIAVVFNPDCVNNPLIVVAFAPV